MKRVLAGVGGAICSTCEVRMRWNYPMFIVDFFSHGQYCEDCATTQVPT